MTTKKNCKQNRKQKFPCCKSKEILNFRRIISSFSALFLSNTKYNYNKVAGKIKFMYVYSCLTFSSRFSHRFLSLARKVC